MQVQSQISRRYKGKEYRKYWAVIPPEIIKEAKLKTGDKLEPSVINGIIMIKKRRRKNAKNV